MQAPPKLLQQPHIKEQKLTVAANKKQRNRGLKTAARPPQQQNRSST
jgi:hypothetical protein